MTYRHAQPAIFCERWGSALLVLLLVPLAVAQPSPPVAASASAPEAGFGDCGQGAQSVGLSTEESATDLPRGDWSAHGLAEADRQKIRDAFQAGVDRGFVPGGTMMLIHRGEVVLEEAFGVADLERQRPFETTSPCRIASLTKLHTATVITILAEQNRLSLDEPIDLYLPAFAGVKVRGEGAASAAPTLRQCLSHTAGFPGNAALKAGNFSVKMDGTLEQTIADLATRPLAAKPGTRYAYSRFGYMVAGRVAEVVTGRSFEDVMRQVLLQPVGAVTATFSPSEDLSEQMPIVYERDGRGLRTRTGEPLGTVINPGGSLVSTLEDVARVLLLHRNQGCASGRRIVSAQALQQMYVAQPATPGTGYGLGFNIMQKRDDGSPVRIRHTGASGTLAVIDFDRDLILIVLTQVPQQQTLRWRSQLVRTITDVFAAAGRDA